MQIIVTTLVFALMSMTGGFAEAVQNPPKTILIEVNNQPLTVEYASTYEERNKGLMHRKTLCSDCGMLFNFQHSRYASMWMKNTYIPLDVAFIQSDGKILDIKPLSPHDLTPVGSSGEVHYALEMNQGWFEKNNVKEGDKIRVIEQKKP
ncbi:DUF192 domain-containing protein [Aestuariibacter sp. AA17]|uniref:DUF192 domain-containing protein n=1 Tax=Fluctibacter corallii TaxID=2984329 RepID=A0ABT3A5T5_9ALTE|nr:DUF192 domain-containing protein [Aestuariibacter sp. AA17]MCV2883627.1 DUF192 domain-containing protein [Aestuariibacter sp. AA17]